MSLVFWHWLALGAVLIGIEMLAPTAWLVGPALAAAITGALALILPVIDAETQIIVFAALAAVSTLLWRRWVRRSPKSASAANLNRRAHSAIGRRANLIAMLPPTGAQVLKLDDTVWRARSADGAAIDAGATVEIVGAEGSLLLVRPVA